MRRAWQKNACYKIADLPRRAAILKELGLLMYDRTSPAGGESKSWAELKIDELEKKYPQESELWEYMRMQWLDKVHMWVVGYRNLKYCGQDTNAAIEGYHGFTKSILRSEKKQNDRSQSGLVYHCTHGGRRRPLLVQGFTKRERFHRQQEITGLCG